MNIYDNSTAILEIPAGFSCGEKGWWYCTDQGEGAKPKRICDYFKVICRVHDLNGGGWGRILQFRTPDGATVEKMVPDELLHEVSTKMAAGLAAMGLKVETSKAARDLLQFLLNNLAAPIYAYVPQSGWAVTSDDVDLFVLPSGEVIGGKGVILQPERVQRFCKPVGLLTDWQREVAAYAVGNSRLAMAISMAFAAPLLRDTNVPSGGVHLIGPSQIAKTSALNVGSSVFGMGHYAGVVGTWSNTKNAMEGVTARYNDLMLPLDEMGQAPPNDVAAIIYQMGNGVGKGRMRQDTSMRAPYTWRTMPLSTGEEKAEDKVRQSKQKLNAGIDVRLANVPADTGKGYGLFENLHGKTPVELADHLRSAAKTYYGTALPEFLKRYVHDRQSNPETINKIQADCKRFVGKYLDNTVSSQVKSVAKRFALIAVAGELAIRYGVLPWPQGEAEQAAVACMNAWVGDRGDTGMAEDQQILSAVRLYLGANMASKFVESVDDPYLNREIHGVKQKNKDGSGNYDFCVFCDQWKHAMPDHNVLVVMRVLKATGFLVLDSTRQTYKHRTKIGQAQYALCYRIDGRILDTE